MSGKRTLTLSLLLWISGCSVSGSVSVIDRSFCDEAPKPQGVVSDRLLQSAQVAISSLPEGVEGAADAIKLLEYTQIQNVWTRQYQNVYDRLGCTQ